MPLSPGIRLGHYDVTALLGQGGMGQVWQATDTQLNRQVALKILPDAFADDPDRLARFQREAQVLASLNHPNIGGIHGLEESDGIKALVLELVEGPTLADRIAKGPIPVDEALPIAKQIAEALEAAHEQGIIHRDLKPANIKVRPDGTVKVLDFGLAKAFQPEASDSNKSMSPTISLTAAATQMGMVIGTAAYMSPEQAKGKPVDRRADIWAFGVVLYEMLAGRAAFGEGDVSDTLASVLKLDPDWTPLPAALHPRLRELLDRCLAKDVTKRFRDIGDVALDLERILADPAGLFPPPVAAASALREPTGRRARVSWTIAATVTGMLVAGLAVWILKPAPPVEPGAVMRFPVRLPADQVFTNRPVQTVAIAPDGRRLVYVANEQLHLRSLDEMASQPISGTAEGPAAPVFSPDGEWLAYSVPREGFAIRRIPVAGGTARTIHDGSPPIRALAWSADDEILFATDDGIRRLPAEGGPSAIVVPPTHDGEILSSPSRLPGGDTILFAALAAEGGSWDTAEIVAYRSGERVPLWQGGSAPRWVSTGHLVYAQGETLWALPVDPVSLQVSGSPVPVVEGITRSSVATLDTAHYAISDTGTLAYATGAGTFRLRTLVWVDRDGVETPLATEPRGYEYLRISHDGRRVAVDEANTSGDIWVWTFDTESFGRITSPEQETMLYPVWTSDDRRIAFGSTAQQTVRWKASSNTGAVELVAAELGAGRQGTTPYFFADGDRLLVYREQAHPETGDNIQMVSLDAEAEPVSLLASRFSERNAALSPDGRWMAYQSDESGQYEVYVRPFPDVEADQWTISTGGGLKPLWSRDGQELFYLELGRPPNPTRLMRAGVETGAVFTHEVPAPLLDWPYESGNNEGRTYDISPDGARFLTHTPVSADATEAEAEDRPRIHVVINWQKELLERVPVP